MNKELKEKLTDRVWYGLTYADGVPIKNLYTYAQMMTENILEFLEENKFPLTEENWYDTHRIVPYDEAEEAFDAMRKG